MSIKPISNVGVIFGAMLIGTGSLEAVTKEATTELLDVFQKHGHTEVDTARMYIDGTLAAFNAEMLHIFYFDSPDRSVPYEDTLREVNKIHADGLFERFGLSNYRHPTWEPPRGRLPHTVFAPGDRFDPAMPFSRFSRGRDWNEPSFKALDILRPAIAPHGITESEATLRWLAYHSVLKEDLGDAVIIGVRALDKGPLPVGVVAALDTGWEEPRYAHWPNT
ncbi:NADP-dependent oxidoreductase domain-containing protein [Mycena leptocephala]|nr:NADP-dependent oxidoreductase domain-containing protein [Mycena leptocephala]